MEESPLSPRLNSDADLALERELIALIEAGHPQAQERLYQAYSKRLLATARHVLGYEDAEAEDAVQEVFIQAAAALPRTKIHSSLYGWLNRVCVLRCIDIIRARRRSLAQQESSLEFLSLPAAIAQLRERDQDEDLGERVLALRRAIESLDEPCRSLVRDRDIDGMSYIDLAKKHSLALGTVMSRLSRCREALKKKMIRQERRSEP
jgi:RNA polymerase sigma-70 factor (ECF subfamily)